MDYPKLFAEIDALADWGTANRRDFHKHAESAWVEFRTTSKIADRLTEWGIPFEMGTKIINPAYVMGRPDEAVIEKNIKRAISQGADERWIKAGEGYTGVVATIDTGRPGPVVALRFDIDSNDANEAVDDMTHRPTREGFASVNPGYQHACGHDGHATIGLMSAKVLWAHKDELCGKIKFFFQPAEEGVRGALSMVEAGGFDDVDYFMCGHIMEFPLGHLIAGRTGLMATKKFDVTYTGRSAHAGASPQAGKNALLAACSATLAAQNYCQDSRGAARVNVGVLNAGVGRNVVPEKAVMKIETRGITTEVSDYVYENVMRVMKSAAEMYDCKMETKITGGAAGLVGSPELIERIAAFCEKHGIAPGGIEKVRAGGGSEDASYMMERVQKRGGLASYMGWGGATVAPHHNSSFDFDEGVLPFGAKTICGCVCDILAKE